MFLNKMKKDHALGINWGVFYRTVISLVVPMALQNLINVGVTAADVIMLGAVGETALSGASLAGQVQYIMTLFLFGLTSGATVLTAQYWGKGDVKTIEKILGMTVKAAIAVTALFTLAALAIPELLMMIFTSDPAVIAEGVRYLRIVAFTYVMIGVTQAYLYVMRSVERVIVATVVYLCSLLCNIVMNSIFIFGLFGLPAMGVAGAALGTLCARILEVILTFGYARIFNKEIRLRPKYILHTERELFRDFMKYALPVVAKRDHVGPGGRRPTPRSSDIWEARRWRPIPWPRWQGSWRRWYPSACPARRPSIWARPSGRRSWNTPEPMRSGSSGSASSWARWAA